MRTLDILFIVSSYIAPLQSVTYTDLKVLYYFICARLAHMSILYQPLPQLDYDADVSDCESVKKNPAPKNKIFKKKKMKDSVSKRIEVEYDNDRDALQKRVLEKRPRKRKKTKDMFDFFC